jgi:hypothetical protein
MNALELADALQASSPCKLDDAARMLRQQQAEIEALKESLTEAQQEALNWEDRYRSVT